MAWEGTASRDPAGKPDHDMNVPEMSRFVLRCPCAHYDIVESAKCKMSTSLAGEILQGFLYAQREVSRCQGNQSGPVPTPAVQSLRTGGSARNMRSWRPNATRSTTETQPRNEGTDVPGSASVTGTCMHTRFVRSVWRKADLPRRSRCITSSHWQKAVTTAMGT